MQAVFSLSRRSIDQLETDIITLSEQINSKEYEFLVLLREFDIREGWKPYLFNNSAEWLNYKCGMELSTGREKVRVARCLLDLPQIAESFKSGALSYSKVRSMTRVATPRNESRLLAHALKSTAAQVQARCQGLRNADRAVSTADANHIHRNRSLRCSQHPDGSMTITVEVTQEAGELVMKAIEKAVADSAREESGDTSRDACNSPEAVDTTNRRDAFFNQQADALVDLARSYLSGGEGKRSCSADHYQVMVHVDERALRSAGKSAQPGKSEGAKSDLPIETIRRLCCDGAIVPITEDETGKQLNVGRKHRIVQPALRRALLARDKCCQYPGCSHSKWLHAHHLEHWADGGETVLENLLLFCDRHHQLLHEGGFSIKNNYLGERYFETSSGRIVT